MRRRSHRGQIPIRWAVHGCAVHCEAPHSASIVNFPASEICGQKKQSVLPSTPTMGQT